MWFKVESGNGDSETLRKLVSMGRTNYESDVRLVMSRILSDRRYPSWYRAEVIRKYIVLYKNQVQGSLVPFIISALDDNEPAVKDAAYELLTLISDEQEARSFLPELNGDGRFFYFFFKILTVAASNGNIVTNGELKIEKTDSGFGSGQFHPKHAPYLERAGG
ncbi:MAG: hypothetical protein JWN25_1148 [Verrucomicrobiales bacterium]|nr:hypothetical protein [Verrucomicrobiales bacterium]